ncbi:MAG TPA: hypothetical protein VHM26_12260 [Chitinophagaceae bacterium]|jgi:hypothetical protein|nr:hypothetical protein [Chitinophagaceae bacterium]
MAKKIRYAWLLFFITPAAIAQDHIVTWDNDTLHGRFSAHPRKEGLRPQYKYNSGFYQSGFYFNNDSLRVLKAGEIKSYYRNEHGKRLLCNGHFESWKVNIKDLHYSRYYRRDTAMQWYFVRKVEDGEHAQLYVLTDDCGRGYFNHYFIHKKGTGVLYSLESKSKAIAYLSDESVKDGLKQFKSRRSKRFYTDIVKEYNRLKELQ